MCINLTVRMETSTCVAHATNWGNIDLAGTNPTYRPLPHRCESVADLGGGARGPWPSPQTPEVALCPDDI